MSDTREDVLVIAEINAADAGFRDDLDFGVALELGVIVAQYQAYKEVAAAIDRYGGLRATPRPGREDQAIPQLARRSPDDGPKETLERLVQAAMDLYRAQPDLPPAPAALIADRARRVLATACELKVQLLRPASRQQKREGAQEKGAGLDH